MASQSPRRAGDEEAGSRLAGWLIGRVIVWMQFAAVIWIGFPTLMIRGAAPAVVNDVLRWLSWTVMVAGSIVLGGLAYRRRELRFMVVASLALWILLLALQVA